MLESTFYNNHRAMLPATARDVRVRACVLVCLEESDVFLCRRCDWAQRTQRQCEATTSHCAIGTFDTSPQTILQVRAAPATNSLAEIDAGFVRQAANARHGCLGHTARLA